MNPDQKEQFSELLPKWQGYKKNLVWTFDGEENALIDRMAWVLLGRHLTSCPSCRVDAMRQLENLYNA